MAERLDDQHYRDDVLRLLFICCHPDLPANQQIALALRIVSGLTVKEIARAFLASEAAMEQRITRAKRRIAAADVPYEAPDAVERSARLGARRGDGLSPVQRRLFGERRRGPYPRCRSARRRSGSPRLLLQLFPGEPEIMGLTALLLLQHARAPARGSMRTARSCCSKTRTARRWDKALIAEGTVLIEKAERHRRPGPFQIQAAIAAVHDAAARAEDTDWAEIDQLYAALERLQPSPVVSLNRAVAVAKLSGPEAALAMIEPLAGALDGYFHFHGLKGGLLKQAGRDREARAAFADAMALANTAAEAAHIRMQLDRLSECATTKP